MFPIYGILATESVDRTGEKLLLNGADISDLSIINDEHQSSRCLDLLGQATLSKKIYNERECTDPYQLRCWNRVKKPFIYIQGNLVAGEHPNSSAAAELIKYADKNPSFPVGFSVEGATLEREGKILKKTKIIAASITVKPCNPECLVFPMVDLRKSMEVVSLPDRYKNALPPRKHFHELPTIEQRLLSKSALMKETMYLLKSGEPLDSACIIKCWNCGEGKLFMRERPPNRCVACSEPFHLIDIFRAKSAGLA